MNLHPFQAAAVAGVRELARGGAKRILLQSPTGTGKTRMGLEFAVGAVRQGGQVLWLAHRRELVAQAAGAIMRAGVADIGVSLAGASTGSTDAAVQVGSIQTLFARGQRPDARVVVWDEAHHCTATTYREVASAYPDAWHIGLTATPERSDHSPLGDVFQAIVVAISSPDAVRRGCLVPVRVYAPATSTDALSEDPLAAWTAHAEGRQTVAFCSSVSGAAELARRFVAAGVPAASIDGTTPLAERTATLAAFAARELRVLCNCQVLTEGWDCPGAQVCILARGCGSAALFLQMVGRVLRPADGKGDAVLIDLRGVVHQHGMPHDERTFNLEGEGIALVSKAGDPIRQCPSCAAVFRAASAGLERECPICGAALPAPAPPRATVERRPLAEIHATASREEKRRAYDRFREQARARGYSQGWAAYRFKGVFGHFPDFSRSEVA